MATVLNTLNDFNAFLSAHNLVVVDFSASWCGPCKRIAPFFEKLVSKYPNVSFAKVDVDENADAAAQESVVSMPTFRFYKNGKNVNQLVGASEDNLDKLVSQLSS